MPLVILLAFALATPLLVIVLMPLGLVQRYRAGTTRRVARRWVATLNVAGLSLSVLLFFAGAVFTSFWVPNAWLYSVAGFVGGCLLAMAGLRLTRWETAQERVHFTPNRWLVLGITSLVMLRLLYGVWRLWQGWQLGGDDRAWLRESGIPGSLAAGALVLGYSLTYWLGVRRQVKRRVGGR